MESSGISRLVVLMYADTTIINYLFDEIIEY
jgi:hypothetical protein